MALGIDAVLQELPGGLYDMQIGDDGDIQTADSFDTYILVALLTDRRANESEVADAQRRRGWIGNEHTPGFEIGSKLWIFEQSRLTGTVLSEIESAALTALQSMVDEGFADAVRSVRAVPTSTGVELELAILRPSSAVERRFFELWNNTGVS